MNSVRSAIAFVVFLAIPLICGALGVIGTFLVSIALNGAELSGADQTNVGFATLVVALPIGFIGLCAGSIWGGTVFKRIASPERLVVQGSGS